MLVGVIHFVFVFFFLNTSAEEFVSFTRKYPLDACMYLLCGDKNLRQNIFVFSISYNLQLLTFEHADFSRAWEYFCEFSFMQCPKPFASWFLQSIML